MNTSFNLYSCHLWKCVDITEYHTKEGNLFGRVFIHKARDKYDYYNHPDVVEKIGKICQLNKTIIFPAKEPWILSLFTYHPNGEEKLSSFSKKIANNPSYSTEYKNRCQKHINSFRKYSETRQYIIRYLYILGYRFELSDKGGYFISPDELYLQNKWKQLQKKYHHLTDLKIAAVSGLLDSKSYIATQLENSAILSHGMEFMHDQYFHLIPMIVLMLSSGQGNNPSYLEIRSEFNEFIRKNYELIQELKVSNNSEMKEEDLEKLEIIFTMYIDATLSVSSYESLRNMIDEPYHWISFLASKDNPIHQKMVQEIFPDDSSGIADIINKFLSLLEAKQNPNLIA